METLFLSILTWSAASSVSVHHPGALHSILDRHPLPVPEEMDQIHDDDHLCIVIADVSGKGVPAALFTMSSKIIIADHALPGKLPSEIIAESNKAICVGNREQLFVTVWLGILEISTGKLTYVNAGHEIPTICQKEGKFKLIRGKHDTLLGIWKDKKFKDNECTLSPGDKLFVYTDGVPEATNAEKELFGNERMVTALNQDPNASPQQVLKNVRASVDEFVKDAEQFDDLTMLCIEYKGKVASN